MTPEKVKAVAEKYGQMLRERGYAPAARFAAELDNPSKEVALRHVLWLVDNIPMLVDQKRIEKAMRWLGFAQGFLWAFGVLTIEQAKLDNMPTFTQENG